jgi:hypothetical protein
VGKTITKFRKDRYEEDDYGHKETKQKRRDKLDLKRFNHFNNEDYQYDPFVVKNKKYRKAA